MKKYLNIKEVSNAIGIEEHTIRYWDSIDPKTNKLRIEGISTRSNKGTRYFNRDNINKLTKLKSLLEESGNQSIKLADKFISINKNMNKTKNSQVLHLNPIDQEKLKKANQILAKMRKLVQKNDKYI